MIEVTFTQIGEKKKNTWYFPNEDSFKNWYKRVENKVNIIKMKGN